MEEEEKYTRLEDNSAANEPLKSVEGWIVYVSGIHPEAKEDDIYDMMSEYGKLRNLHLNQDRRTGSNKGYALGEYGEVDHAKDAIKALNGLKFLGKELKADFAFKHPV